MKSYRVRLKYRLQALKQHKNKIISNFLAAELQRTRPHCFCAPNAFLLFCLCACRFTGVCTKTVNGRGNFDLLPLEGPSRSRAMSRRVCGGWGGKEVDRLRVVVVSTVELLHIIIYLHNKT